MIHRFIIEIETDEANVEDLQDAIRDALEHLELENGDTLYIDNPKIRVYNGL